MKKFINLLMVLVALFLGFYSLKYIIKANQSKPMVSANVTPSTKPADLPMVAGSGVVEPSSELIQISPQVPGIISEVLVKVNQEVKMGDVLFRLDCRELKAQQKSRQAQLALAQKNIELSRVDVQEKKDKLDRYLKIKDARAVVQEELSARQFAYENSKSRLEVAKSQWQENKAFLDEIETAISLREVKSPIDGTILQVKARLGQFAPANILSEALMTIGNLNPLYIRVDIDEADINRIDFQAKAMANTRGSHTQKQASFIRVEPLVVPKKSLTNALNERVDTRVLQVIYALEDQKQIFVGQQVDVFIPSVEMRNQSNDQVKDLRP
jgi:RND family efflux transporter MFP subunit